MRTQREWMTMSTVIANGNSLAVNITEACRKLDIKKGDNVVITVEKVSE